MSIEIPQRNLPSTSLLIFLPNEKDNAATFGPNSKLHGQVWVTITKKTRIQRLFLSFSGNETTYVENSKSILTKNRRQEKLLFMVDSVLWERSSTDKDPFLPGTYIFPFYLYIPRVNYPQTTDLKAVVEKIGSLSTREKTVKAVDINFMPLSYPSSPRDYYRFSENIVENLGKSTINFQGYVNAKEFLPGEKYELKFQVSSMTPRCKIRKVKMFFLQKITTKYLVNGKESFSDYVRTLSKTKVQRAKKPKGMQKPESLHFESDIVSVNVPNKLSDFDSGSLRITHSIVLSVKLKNMNENSEKGFFHSVINSSSQTCSFHIPAKIVHVDPQFFTTSSYSNSYLDGRLNIKQIKITDYLSSPMIPDLQLDPSEKIKFVPWDSLHPLWFQSTSNLNN
ncbi:hypothetical protein BB560_000456 [Smittium megazygosporum]|uniref:Arrestin-like N-terminal domain-containing protein n=1 Tax=Smittium megazygosporum TaxID=133381 RepID=A0A2T9ZKB0_9FUNG|nr:hypothetical protein BB560_000456 [Smittium megazygosporum]